MKRPHQGWLAGPELAKDPKAPAETTRVSVRLANAVALCAGNFRSRGGEEISKDRTAHGFGQCGRGSGNERREKRAPGAQTTCWVSVSYAFSLRARCVLHIQTGAQYEVELCDRAEANPAKVVPPVRDCGGCPLRNAGREGCVPSARFRARILPDSSRGLRVSRCRRPSHTLLASVHSPSHSGQNRLGPKICRPRQAARGAGDAEAGAGEGGGGAG